MDRKAELRDALEARLLKIVQNGVEVMTEGGVATIDPPAAVLSVVAAYLKAFPPIEAPVQPELRGALKAYRDRFEASKAN